MEVHAFIENAENYRIAASTPGLPPNLRFHRAIWESDYDLDGVTFDMTCIVSGNDADAERFARYSPIVIPSE